MKTNIMFLILSITVYTTMSCQTSNKNYTETTFDKMNKNQPRALADYKDFIGNCNCKSLSRNRFGKWGDTISLQWKWKYIMNGHAIQDDGEYILNKKHKYFTSIRVYDTINKHWYVSYFTPNLNAMPETWIGGKVGNNIILKKEQKTTQGIVESVLTFSNISTKGFNWEGKLMSKEKNIDYSFWKIWCIKEE